MTWALKDKIHGHQIMIYRVGWLLPGNAPEKTTSLFSQ